MKVYVSRDPSDKLWWAVLDSVYRGVENPIFSAKQGIDRVGGEGGCCQTVQTFVGEVTVA